MKGVNNSLNELITVPGTATSVENLMMPPHALAKKRAEESEMGIGNSTELW